MNEPDLGDAVIVVPSIHIDPLLERCIRTCRELYPDTRILALVDDDDGRERVESMADVILTGPITIGAKRNIGVDKSTEPYVAFIDSDAYPEVGWLESATSLLRNDPGLGAAGGPDVCPRDEPWAERCVGVAHNSALVCGYWRYRRKRSAPARDVTKISSCNLIVRREDYLAVNGMSETLFTAEDTDLCRRLCLSGQRIRFDPNVIVVHKNRNLRTFAIQRYTFGVGMVPLIGRGRAHPAYWAVSFLSALFVLFLGTGALTPWLRWWRRPWSVVTCTYLAVLSVESVRHAPARRHTVGTFAAVAIGNLAPGVGMLARIAGCRATSAACTGMTADPPLIATARVWSTVPETGRRGRPSRDHCCRTTTNNRT